MLRGFGDVPGYSQPAYASSLVHLGEPYPLPDSGAFLLRRRIAHSGLYDAIGCYPLFTAPRWPKLPDDLDQVRNLVSIAVVTDPFGAYGIHLLEQCFPDRLDAFKQHYVVDLDGDPNQFVAASHRRSARAALRRVEVDTATGGAAFADDWIRLYRHLTQRHGISGPAAFPAGSLAQHLSLPGMRVFNAFAEGQIVAMTLWLMQGDVVYYHLGASDSTGYERRASFALFWEAIAYYKASGVRWLDLGGAAGLQDAETGLARFKRGWATGHRTAYFGGRICDRAAYQRLAAASTGAPSLFPAYRARDLSGEPLLS
jgi:Acetyltransferase (GNAT) domain